MVKGLLATQLGPACIMDHVCLYTTHTIKATQIDPLQGLPLIFAVTMHIVREAVARRGEHL
jgi:hypothetical protein